MRWGVAVRVRYIQTIFWERKCHFITFYLRFSLHTLEGSVLSGASSGVFLRKLSAWVPPRGGVIGVGVDLEEIL